VSELSEEMKRAKPVLVEVRIDGRNGGVFDVGRSSEIRETLSEVDSITTLSKMRKLLNWGWC